MVYPYIQIAIYPNIQLCPCRIPRRDTARKNPEKDLLSAGLATPENLNHPLRSKFIFLQCKKPFPPAPRSGERRMLPMVAVRKLGEGCR